MDEIKKKNEDSTIKVMTGTLIYGIIINYVILFLDDVFEKTDGKYMFILFVSLFIGWLVSLSILKFGKK
jgi:hypothetical protein